MSVAIGERLVKLRKEKKYTQEDLANMAGVSNVMISRYENGEKEMSVDTLVKIAKALGTSLDYIVIGDGELIVDYKQNKKSEGEEIARAIVTLINNRLLYYNSYNVIWFLNDTNELYDFIKNINYILNDDDANEKGYIEFLETKIRNYAEKYNNSDG